MLTPASGASFCQALRLSESLGASSTRGWWAASSETVGANSLSSTYGARSGSVTGRISAMGVDAYPPAPKLRSPPSIANEPPLST